MNPLRKLVHHLATMVLLSFSTAALAQTLTGRVVSPSNVPIPNIVVDAGSGSTSSTSNALGLFTLTGLQVNHVYDVEFVPPVGAPWAARRITHNFTATVNLGDIVLQPGHTITGIARNEAGAGLLGCNLNVYDQTGVKQFTPRDGTDASGNFQIVVAANTWDVRVVPPVGTLLVPRQFEDLVVSGPVNLGIVTLRTAYLVTGTVADQVTGVPVGNTRIRAYNALTGERIYMPNDTANLFGQFSLALPRGIADFEVEPPLGNTHVGRQIYGTIVLGNLAMGSLGLQNGVLLSGTVTANGSPVAGADIDVLFADGSKVFTPRDTTAANGTFTVAVPTSTALATRVEAPTGTNLVGMVTAPQTFVAPSNLGALSLFSGVAVSGTVTGTQGPELNTSVRFFDSTTHLEIITTGSHSNASGQYATHVPAGSYDVQVRTAEGSFSQPAQQLLTIGAAANANFALQDKLARTALTSFGTPTLPQGAQLPINILLHSMAPGFQTLRIDLAVRLANGTEILLLPGLPLTLPPVPFQIDFVLVPIPPIPAGNTGKVIDMVIRLRDSTGTVVLDEAKTPFVVQ